MRNEITPRLLTLIAVEEIKNSADLVVFIQTSRVVGFFLELLAMAGILKQLENYFVVGYLLRACQIGDSHSALANFTNNLIISENRFFR